MSQTQQKRQAVIITSGQFTQLMNHFLINLGMFVSTSLIEEGKAEGAPSTQGFNVILGNKIGTKSEILGLLNTYCENVTLVSNKELGMVAQCEVLIGEKSTLPEPEQPKSPGLGDVVEGNDSQDLPDQEG